MYKFTQNITESMILYLFIVKSLTLVSKNLSSKILFERNFPIYGRHKRSTIYIVYKLCINPILDKI